MPIRVRLRTSTATLLATSVFFAGGQDLTTESDLDFTGRQPQSTLQRPLKKRKKRTSFCVLDLETTGFVVTREAIIEIGLIRVARKKSGIETQEFAFLVRPPMHIPRKIRVMTGITNELVADAATIDQVIPEIKRIVGDLPIVAHNANFDRRFLELKANLLNMTFANNEWICSLKMARQAWPALPNHRLETLALEFGEYEPTHRALDDCRATLEIYEAAHEQLGGDLNIAPLPLPEFVQEPEDAPSYDADLSNEVFVFSGFRDEVLAARIENSGGEIKSGISRKVTKLLVESTDLSTGKVKKANEYQIEVQSRAEFESTFYF